jgi:Tfp pilus assembly protein PilN
MAKTIVTLHVDDTSIRLLEAHGKRLRKWADMPLEPGLVKGGVVIKEAEVATKIRQLLKAQKVRAKKVIVGLSGIHCLSRPLAFPQLPKAMLDEAVMREAKRVLPVPVEQLHISWQIIPVPEGKAQIYLLAIPRKTTDAMIRTLRQGKMSEGLGYPVLPLSPSLECPESFPANRYMVNVGLVLKEPGLGREAGALAVNINALPLVYQPKPISWVRVIALPIIITIAAGLIPLCMLIQSGSAHVASVQDQLDHTNQLFTEKQSAKQELKGSVVELQAELAEAEASRDNFTAALSSLEQQGNEVNHNLEEVVSALSDTIILDNISHAEGTLTVSGSSPSAVEVLQYAQRLDDSGRFAGVTIASIRKVEVDSVEAQSAEAQSAEDQSAEDQSVEDQSAEDQSVEDQSAEGESNVNVMMDFTLILKIGG